MSEKNKTLFEKRKSAVPQGPFHVTDRFIEKAKGALVWDVDGKEYIDFAGGIGCLNAGHCPDSVVKAIQEQAAKCIHSCFHVMAYEPYVALAEKLNQITPGDFEKQTIFFNSGAEAVDNAIKIARRATGRAGIICFENGFHGRTLLGVSLTGKIKPYKFGFGPYVPEIYRAPSPYNYMRDEGTDFENDGRDLDAYWDRIFKGFVAPENVAAIIIEPVMGEGGFLPVSKPFMKKIRAICDEYGIVMIADEVQCGFCRTGKMFAMEHYDAAPDLFTLGKSIASGMPLSAVTGKQTLLESVQVGGLGGTYAGNPLACAAGLATIDIYEKENLADRAVLLGNRVKALFQKHQESCPFIGDIRGLGAMIGIEFVNNRDERKPNPDVLKKLLAACLDRGLLLMSAGPYGQVLRTLMPLVITDEQMDKALNILDEEITKL